MEAIIETPVEETVIGHPRKRELECSIPTLLGYAIHNPRVYCLVVEVDSPGMLARFHEVQSYLEAFARNLGVFPFWWVLRSEWRLKFASGTVLYFHHADSPERLRGLCPDAVWVPPRALAKQPGFVWHFRTNAGDTSRMFTELL